MKSKILNLIQIVLYVFLTLCALLTFVTAFANLCNINHDIYHFLGDFSVAVNLAFTYIFPVQEFPMFLCSLILLACCFWLLFYSIMQVFGRTKREIWSLISFGVAIILASFAFITFLNLAFNPETTLTLLISIILLAISIFSAVIQFRAVLKKG